MCRSVCRSSRWWAFPTRASARAATASGPPSAIPGFEFPGHRITVNLAPADVRKAGASYDLPIALGVLAASGVIEPRLLEGVVLLGELSLDGAIQPIRGVLPVAVAAKREGKAAILLPRANAPEASVVEGLKVLPVDSLVEAVEALNAGLA